MNKPEIIKANNDYPCSDCGGHGVPRTEAGTHYIECHKCKARTRYCLEGESEARYEWASMNASKNALKSCFSGQVGNETLEVIPASRTPKVSTPDEWVKDNFDLVEMCGIPERCIPPIECIECLKPIDESLLVKHCEGCLEPIHYLCECSNCNL